jgi:hypothetical protein
MLSIAPEQYIEYIKIVNEKSWVIAQDFLFSDIIG